jgi:prepilin-type N-terminal cleavage/methylation domain-containing protein
VITPSAKERFLREERGFSLTEMMVTILIMIVVFFALHSIFDMSVKVFSYGNSTTEAVENARAGLEKMEREIRQANGDAIILETRTPTEIRFGNDLDGNGVIQCPDPDDPTQCEKIGYQVYETPAGSGNYALGRDNSSTGTTNTVANLQPVSEPVDYVDAANTGLSFEYFGKDCGDEDPDDPDQEECDAADPDDQIERVRIELRISVESAAPQDARQTLTTDVTLRNRGG